jgi:hypothetical protein
VVVEDFTDDRPGFLGVGEEVVQFHRPPGPRNGGMPLSIEMPAPVKAMRWRACRIREAADVIVSGLSVSR